MCIREINNNNNMSLCIREINNNNNMSLCIREINNNNKVSLLIEARLNAGNWEHIFFVRLSQRGGGVGCGGREVVEGSG